MTLIIPYTFVAGTKAQSAQVNENFQAVATEVNSLGSDLADAETDITTLTNNKADLNGSTSNRFAVANPVNNYDAVNKQTFASLCMYVIGGLKLSRGGTNIISCTPGAGYDTTVAKILVLASATSKTNSSQVASATYYVYLVGQSNGTGTDLLISTSSANPPLPTGYDLYLPLGYYTTNSSNDINGVYGYSNATNSDVANVGNNRVGYPNLSAGIGKSWATDITADTDGWISASAYVVNGSSTTATVNGVNYSQWWVSDANGHFRFWFPVKTGDVYRADGGYNSQSLIFYPNR